MKKRISVALDVTGLSSRATFSGCSLAVAMTKATAKAAFLVPDLFDDAGHAGLIAVRATLPVNANKPDIVPWDGDRLKDPEADIRMVRADLEYDGTDEHFENRVTRALTDKGVTLLPSSLPVLNLTCLSFLDIREAEIHESCPSVTWGALTKGADRRESLVVTLCCEAAISRMNLFFRILSDKLYGI